MDGKPYRLSRPAERRTAAETAHRQDETQPPVHPQPAQRVSRQAPEKKSKKGLISTLVGFLVVIILVAGGWFAWSQMQTTTTGIEANKYQAVFFTNGQVYFGKLHAMNGQYMKLTDIFYLQTQSSDGSSTSDNPQKTSSDKSNVQLIKLGDEIHGPEDEMIISKDQVLFYENLKKDGKVAQTIDKYNSAH